MHIEYTLLNGYKKVLLLGFMFLLIYKTWCKVK